MRERRKAWRNIFILIELPEALRTSRENKRVETFLKKKAELEARCTNECKVCGKKICVPSDFCGSNCRREYNTRIKKANLYR